jgi:hypothetical protein
MWFWPDKIQSIGKGCFKTKIIITERAEPSETQTSTKKNKTEEIDTAFFWMDAADH